MASWDCRVYSRQINVAFSDRNVVVPPTCSSGECHSPTFLGYIVNIKHHVFVISKSSLSVRPTSLNASEHCDSAGVGAATDSRQLLNSRVNFSLVVAYSRVRHTRVKRTLEYVLPGL